MILVKGRQQVPLHQIKNLNMWGNQLTDVSIIEDMPLLEVVSFSMNNVASLASFAHCHNLAELYLRKNNVTDLSELRHLQANARLRILWLGSNPCATEPNYRLKVIRALPQLQKLDDLDITQEEHDQAQQLAVLPLPLSQQQEQQNRRGDRSPRGKQREFALQSPALPQQGEKHHRPRWQKPQTSSSPPQEYSQDDSSLIQQHNEELLKMKHSLSQPQFEEHSIFPVIHHTKHQDITRQLQGEPGTVAPLGTVVPAPAAMARSQHDDGCLPRSAAIVNAITMLLTTLDEDGLLRVKAAVDLLISKGTNENV
eukprot:TRINITY_DN6454_c0_g1_i1.p1 TRINITY_DN6454_c0_g1~~TRINITY_DN6454_c0_g1_i1.p1  ORF type:complete len:341 (+),score=99.48 TRINITY_DN6454_c0_g1_i1:91-1023(+)